MFDFVHNHKFLLQIILGMIMLPFAFFGLESYQRVFNSSAEVAEVAGTKITDQEFAKALRDQQERLSRALRGIDPSLLDTPEMRGELLDGLITQRLLTVYGIKNNLMAGDNQLRELIANEPAFQDNGKFSPENYAAMLRAQGLTEQGFEANLRQDIAMQQLLTGLTESGFVPTSVARRLALARGEQREVSEIILAPEQFASQVKLVPEAIQAYYDANKTRFQIPEQVRAEYVTLTAEGLAAQESLAPGEARKWYDDNMGAKSAERAVAKKKAEEALAEVQKNPGNFAELAKKYSQDPGSKDKGGDLGFFGRGMMVKAFEAAAWKLQPGQISGLVESDFGFHIIKLVAVKGDERQASHILIPSPQVKDFEESKADIERDLKKQRAGKKYAESAEVFSNTAYEQAESLQPLADKFKLPVQKSDWFTRQGIPGATAQTPFGNPKLLAALFGEDALKNKRNTEAVEISPGVLVVARMLEHKPVVTRPFDEVRQDVVKILTRNEALALAQKAGADKLAALAKGEQAGLTWGATKLVSRDAPAGFKPDVLASVFGADGAKLPVYSGLALSDKGYALYRVSKVMPQEKIEPEKEKGVRQQLTRVVAAQEYQGFVASLRDNGKVQVNKAALEKKQQQ
jgi:peptidyl-prolyl cis-trans isomerase D